MKADAPHTVPLTSEAIKIVETLPRFQNGGHLFSTPFGQKPVCGFSKAKTRLDSLMLDELRSFAADPNAVEIEPWTIQYTISDGLFAPGFPHCPSQTLSASSSLRMRSPGCTRSTINTPILMKNAKRSNYGPHDCELLFAIAHLS
jgi:hypothetical protein